MCTHLTPGPSEPLSAALTRPVVTRLSLRGALRTTAFQRHTAYQVRETHNAATSHAKATLCRALTHAHTHTHTRLSYYTFGDLPLTKLLMQLNNAMLHLNLILTLSSMAKRKPSGSFNFRNNGYVFCHFFSFLNK